MMLAFILFIVLLNVRHPNIRGSLPAENEQLILLSFLPYFHSYGMIGTIILALAGGFQIITLPRFSPEEVLSCIEKYKVNETFVFALIL